MARKKAFAIRRTHISGQSSAACVPAGQRSLINQITKLTRPIQHAAPKASTAINRHAYLLSSSRCRQPAAIIKAASRSDGPRCAIPRRRQWLPPMPRRSASTRCRSSSPPQGPPLLATPPLTRLSYFRLLALRDVTSPGIGSIHGAWDSILTTGK